jgi:isoleucyl-tRNA synthetase
LNNWYIRRSRDRFWRASYDESKRDAFDTLFTVLVTTSRALAPLLPFLTEHMHVILCNGSSVHLEDWPDVTLLPDAPELVTCMDLAREVCSAALAIRTEQGLRVRQPLRELIVAHPDAVLLEPMRALIADEVNVKSVTLARDPSVYGVTVVAVDPRIGRRLGAALRGVRTAGFAGEWTALGNGRIEILGHVVEPNEYEMRFNAEGGVNAESFANGAGVVVLDTRVDSELEREGMARDFVRLVQDARKDAGLRISDRIRIELRADERTLRAVEEHTSLIQHEVLATEITRTDAVPRGFVMVAKLQGLDIEFGIERAHRI